MENGYLRILFIGIILTTCLSFNQYGPLCPIQIGTILTDNIRIGINGDIVMTNLERYCYNYTLVKYFLNKPSIAIGLSKFEALPSSSLYLSIKPYHQHIDSLNRLNGYQGYGAYHNNYIPFSVNLLSQYTSWTLIEFYFIAEDKPNMEAGYYMVDLGELADCGTTGKSIDVFLPFQNCFDSKILEVYTFLHGFQINSQLSNGINSPLQLQIINKITNQTGLIISVSVTSSTQVYEALISYVVFHSNSTFAKGSEYIYDYYMDAGAVNTQNFAVFSAHVKTNQIQGVLQGISGFILNSNQISIQFNANFQSQTGIFNISLNKFWKYVAYDFIIFLGGVCADCSGHIIFYNGSCIDSCPSPTLFNGYTCILCSASQIWNGTDCINRCNGGQIYSTVSSSCSCPINTQWNGFSCLPCYGGKIWNPHTQICQCQQGQNWNGKNCFFCDAGKIYDSISMQCICPRGYILTTNNFCILNCTNGQFWNSSINECQCPQSFTWNGYSCSQCTGGMILNSFTNQCQCVNSVWNGLSCGTTCNNGQVWNAISYVCQCPQFTYPFSGGCIACGSTPQDQQYTQCRCKAPMYFNGYICVACTGGQQWNSYFYSCSCPSNQNWNGTQCVSLCNNGYQSIANQCFCPPSMYQINGRCVIYENCQNGTTWNGNICQPIQCNPGSFWNGSVCTSTSLNCPFQTYWNGFFCSSVPNNCPNGTRWTGQFCVTIQQNCPNGTYWNNNVCVSIPSQCPSGLVWNVTQSRCVTTSSTCPSGTYFNGFSCLPYSNCTGGRVWSNAQIQCVCPQTSLWNGNSCIPCNDGQLYGFGGCFCPNGTYYNGSNCVYINANSCNLSEYSVMNNGKCICLQGFDNVAGTCICKGLIIQSICYKCASKPNSFWNNYACQCQSGFVQFLGLCLASANNTNNNPFNNTNSICSVGNYFQNSQKKCILCSDGCLSCNNCYNCLQCRPEYYYFLPTLSCIQTCGDGLRFSLECDDGNNINGDGCSRDCKVQNSYTCSGGSPNSKDFCTLYKPSSIQMKLTGQSHLYGKIIVNVKLNYLPNSFVNGPDCTTTCDKILVANIISGFSSSTSIVSSYIKSTSYSFSIQIDFGREPIGIFVLQVSINQNLKSKFFPNIDINASLTTEVNPAYLALADRSKQKNNSLN